MVVIGCDCDGQMCEFIRETPAQWTTVAECEASLQHQRLSAGNFSYPTVTGLCRTVVTDEHQLVAAPPATEEMSLAEPAVYSETVGGRRSLLDRTVNGYAIVRDRLGRAAAGTAAVARRSSGRLIDRLAGSF
jgi:hypothetical protein